jgi:hypothetical protein
MKTKDVKVGATYAVKVCGVVVPVRITAESRYGGWVGRSQKTGREVRIRSAARLRPLPPGRPGPGAAVTSGGDR